MNAHQTVVAAKRAVPLEAIEFELALYAENIRQSGFEASVMRALAKSGGSLLFLMPVADVPDCQRVAAILSGGEDGGQILLVQLRAGGDAFLIEPAEESSLTPFASVAASYRNVLQCLAGGAEVTTH